MKDPILLFFQFELILFRLYDESPCFDIRKELLDRLISEGKICF